MYTLLSWNVVGGGKHAFMHLWWIKKVYFRRVSGEVWFKREYKMRGRKEKEVERQMKKEKI